MSRPRAARVRYWLVVLSCGLAVTGPALLVALLVVRLGGWDPSRWPTWAVMAAVVAVLAGTAGVLSEPLVSRLQGWIERRASAEHTD